MSTSLPADGGESIDEIHDEIADLERRLFKAKERLAERNHGQTSLRPQPSTSSTHFLLLLSDSALPLGSFAFSSGFESYQAHIRASLSPAPSGSSTTFSTFLPLSLAAQASSQLPFLLAAHRYPSQLPELDDALDAATPCAVARRASVAQGRALLAVWEKAFVAGLSETTRIPPTAATDGSAATTLLSFSRELKASTLGVPLNATHTKDGAAAEDDDLPPLLSAHLAPLFGAVSCAVGLSAEQAAYVFMLGHAKALVSAAVRAGAMGPYQAQRVLAAAGTRRMIETVVAREWGTRWEAAGQCVPVVDLWVGRHEVLYSRIFNS